jgi:DNA-binding MarR family transcriptional regulator
MISPEQVSERYLTVHHRMHRAVDNQMMGCGLNLARTKVLHQLQHVPARSSVLATELGLAPHTITDIVDALERDGMVTRLPDPSDRRAKLVALTGQGEVALAAASRAKERITQLVFGSFNEADRATMIRLLGVIDDAVTALADQPVVPLPAIEPAEI